MAGGIVPSIHMSIPLKDPAACRFDLLSLGEVMLRLDPGEGRVHTARQFAAYEGGGEYNVARGLRRCFGLRTGRRSPRWPTISVGRLVEDLVLQGGVDTATHPLGARTTASVATARNGLNFTERGLRRARGCRHAPTAGIRRLASCQPGDVDWDDLFGRTRRALAAHRRHLRRRCPTRRLRSSAEAHPGVSQARTAPSSPMT